MNPQFGTVVIVGVGLLGGSLGLALKQRGLANLVRGVGRRKEVLDTALALKAIDEGTLDLGGAMKGADLVVLCTPAAQVPSQLDVVRTRIAPHVVVTDVASTKAEICARVRTNWSEPYRFVGSHPMAGSEKYGPEHATATLYEGCITLVEPRNNHADDAYEKVVSLWAAVGARVVEIPADLHDGIVAKTSHIPHIIAALVAEQAANAGDVKHLVGKGFRDVTRIAEGRAEIWRDICLTNRNAIAKGLREFGAQLNAVREMIEHGEADDLDRFFQAAQAARRKVLDE
ncbi:MAG: prephenate dehydrogenase/arogenate dehydrogenase family protein [Candidatus Hydrogenedentes bacterium]|nr:prephenate dehydrogenase/arogenate dehydrogenase family protein [Candidatus Hydrogenedentota bacterium]